MNPSSLLSFFKDIDTAQKTILLIDEEYHSRTAIGHLLRSYGFHVLEANDGHQGLWLATSEKPDMIFLDIMNPSMDGIRLIRLLREQLGTLLIPVILITGSYSVEQRIQAYLAGADDIMIKPVDNNELLARVERSLVLWNQLASLTFLDALTGIYNRRFFENAIVTELNRALRHKQVFSVVMVDIDHFKQFNDTCGHQAGDFVLRSVAGFIRQSLRKQDLVCRYGGEEFTIIMPLTVKTDACRVMDRIRRNMEQTPFTMSSSVSAFHVRISAGIAEFPTDAHNETELLNAADQALYHAKNHGRNQVIAFSPSGHHD